MSVSSAALAGPDNPLAGEFARKETPTARSWNMGRISAGCPEMTFDTEKGRSFAYSSAPEDPSLIHLFVSAQNGLPAQGVGATARFAAHGSEMLGLGSGPRAPRPMRSRRLAGTSRPVRSLQELGDASHTERHHGRARRPAASTRPGQPFAAAGHDQARQDASKQASRPGVTCPRKLTRSARPGGPRSPPVRAADFRRRSGAPAGPLPDSRARAA